MLYCFLDPLVNLTNDWLLETAVPVTKLCNVTQLMPRHVAKKKMRNIDPDSKTFVGWQALRQKLARTPQVFLKAHRGGKWGAWQKHDFRPVNQAYAMALKQVMSGLDIIGLSIDEVTIDGASNFVSILTDPRTAMTGYGTIQVCVG